LLELADRGFGPRFSEPRAPRERGGRGELVLGLGVTEERPEQHAPWPTAMELVGARDKSTRGLQFMRKLVGKSTGKKSATNFGGDGSVLRVERGGHRWLLTRNKTQFYILKSPSKVLN